jgi:hypothetical protein
MTELSTDQNFAFQYTEIANLLPPGSAKDKLMRNAERITIMNQTGQEWQDVLLDVDREPSAFDSKGLYESIAALDEVQQKSMQHGIQWLNHMDGISIVLVGSYAMANFTDTFLMAPSEAMSFITLAYKFDRLVQHAKAHFNVVVSPENTYVNIPILAAKVYSTDANPSFDDIMPDAKLVKIFGGLVLASARQDFWDIQ